MNTYEVILKNDLGFLHANYVALTKSGKALHLRIGECNCGKRSCNCTEEFTIPIGLILNYEEGSSYTLAPKVKPKKVKYNLSDQYYRGIKLNLIHRDYKYDKAKRYILNGTNQNVWIPNRHLLENGTLLSGQDIDYVFRKSQRQLELAGYTGPIPGIKRTSSYHHTGLFA